MSKNKLNQKNNSSQKSAVSTDSIHKKTVPLYIIFGFLILFSIYMLSPLSNIDTVNVQGNTEVADQAVIENSGIQSGDPVWSTVFNQGEIEQTIVDNIPQASEAELSFSGIDTFTLNIQEFSTIAFLENEPGEHVKVLENGELAGTESGTVGERPILLNFQDDEVLAQLVEQLNQLDESIIQLISEIEKVDLERNPLLVRTYMNDGSQVIASIPSYAERISLYPQLVETVDGQKGIFDLEAGAYFTPFAGGGEQSSDQEQPSGNTEQQAEESTENSN